MFASTICAFVGSRGKKTVCNSCARKQAVQSLCKSKFAPDSVQTCARISRQVFPLLSTPYFTNGGSGWLAGRMPASWRDDCHATGGCVPPGTAGSSQRDSEAAGGQHKTMLSSMNRAVGRVSRGETAGTRCRGFPLGYGIGAALQITSLVRLPGSHPSCQPSAEPKFSSRGRDSSGAARECAPVYADSPVIWRSVGRSAARATRGATQPGAQTDGRGVSLLPVLGVRADCFV